MSVPECCSPIGEEALIVQTSLGPAAPDAAIRPVPSLLHGTVRRSCVILPSVPYVQFVITAKQNKQTKITRIHVGIFYLHLDISILLRLAFARFTFTLFPFGWLGT